MFSYVSEAKPQLALDVENEWSLGVEPDAEAKFPLPIHETMTPQLQPKNTDLSMYLKSCKYSRTEKNRGLHYYSGSELRKKSNHTVKLLLCMSAVLCCCMATVSTEIFAQKHSSLVFT